MICPRCGTPVKGYGKTGMCQPCAATLLARKRPNFMVTFKTGSAGTLARRSASRRKRLHPVTLPTVDK